MRRKRGRGRWRRLRAGLVTPSPGGPGQPSDPTMRVCLQWLDEAGGEGRREPPGWKGPPAFPVTHPEARPRGQKSRDGAPNGDALSPKRAPPQGG